MPAKQRTHEIVRVTLRGGQVLEIHDDLISTAFRELGEDLRNYHRIAQKLANLAQRSQAILDYVAKKGVVGEPVLMEQVGSCLEETREILKELRGEQTNG